MKIYMENRIFIGIEEVVKFRFSKERRARSMNGFKP